MAKICKSVFHLNKVSDGAESSLVREQNLTYDTCGNLNIIILFLFSFVQSGFVKCLLGMGLILFTAAHMVLCFVFVNKSADNTPVFLLLLRRGCTESRLFLSHCPLPSTQ